MLSEIPTSPPQVDYSSSSESRLCSPFVTGSNQCDKDGIFRFSTPNVAESPSSSAAKKLKRKNRKKIVEKMKHARQGVEFQKLICLNKKKTWKKCSENRSRVDITISNGEMAISAIFLTVEIADSPC